MNLPAPHKLPIIVQCLTATVIQEREDEDAEWLYVSLKRDECGQPVMHLQTTGWTMDAPTDIAVITTRIKEALGELMKVPNPGAPS